MSEKQNTHPQINEPIFVKPREGVKVADPVAKDFLPSEGREVQASIYWLRRIDDGDAIYVHPTLKPTAKSNKKDA